MTVDRDFLAFMASTERLTGYSISELVAAAHYYIGVLDDIESPWSPLKVPTEFQSDRFTYFADSVLWIDTFLERILAELERREKVGVIPAKYAEEGTLKAIKERIPVQDVLEQYVDVIRHSGNRWSFRCHIHGDKHDRNPSGSIDTEKNRWHCFGCNRGGSNIDAAMVYGGMDFRQALGKLGAMIGLDLSKPLRKGPKLDVRGGVDID